MLVFETEERSRERFVDLRLDALNVIESSLSECVFENVHCRSTSFGGGVKQSRLSKCTFTSSHLLFAGGSNARLEGCTFADCRLEHLFATDLELVDCAFPGTEISTAVFHGNATPGRLRRSRRKMNEFRGNDFSGAKLLDVDFRGGIDLSVQRLPGDGYLLIQDMSRAREIVGAWLPQLAEPDDIRHGKGLVALLDLYIRGGQRMQLLNLATYGQSFGKRLRQRLGQ